jgi:2-polyprenyl-3-methyl-5-hydroxy-6-metoxy-1,4-benzoquinol methylase
MKAEQIRGDFDEIARLTDGRESGGDRYDAFLASLVPAGATELLEIGCGLGRLTRALASGGRTVTGMDLSPEMIARARGQSANAQNVTFLYGDFLEHDFGSQRFDFIVSAATLHHVPEDVAVPRMAALLLPGGRLVIHDLRNNSGLLDHARSLVAWTEVAAARLMRTGSARMPRDVREAWARHGAGEKYLTIREAQALAHRLLPDARVFHHWLWRYTIVWDKPGQAAPVF